MNHLTEYARAVYDVLCREAGAREGACDYEEFLASWPHSATEYRFMGSLGWGGKVWYNAPNARAYVTCYPEDATNHRQSVIARTNEALRALNPSAFFGTPEKGSTNS